MKSHVVRLAASVLAAGTLLVSCSTDSDSAEEPDRPLTVKSVDHARAQSSEIVSEILDATAIKGSAIDTGPGVSACPDDPERESFYLVRHPWSIYDVPRETLDEGMDRLRRVLPQQGWEIIEDGELDNPNRTPRILFENKDLEYAAHVTIEGGREDALLHVSMVSTCYRAPEGEDLNTEF